MTGNISLGAIKKLLVQIKHPAIDSTLFDLGIIRDIKVQRNKAIIILAFPFENIPIKDQLVGLIKESLAGINADIEIKTAVMSPEELKKFLTIERENWKQ